MIVSRPSVSLLKKKLSGSNNRKKGTEENRMTRNRDSGCLHRQGFGWKDSE